VPVPATAYVKGMSPIAGRSVWADTFPEHERAAFPSLERDLDVDVAIVGGGLTGLWTAWHLLQRDATLRVAVIERETVGFGASGRNGGWCSALLPMSLAAVESEHGAAAATRMQRAMLDNVHEVVAFGESHAIGDACHLGGTISLARTQPQIERLRQRVAEFERFGFADDYHWIGAEEARHICNASDVLGAIYTPTCATVHPLRLTHAVARAVDAAGARIVEHTAVERIVPRQLTTSGGTVHAEIVVRATEGYTAQFDGERRALLPIYSLMIATEPIPDDAWASIGLADRPTFHDGRRLIIYGQRTTDGRIAFGGRGAPYHFGSKVRPEFDTDEGVRALLTESLRELFPVLAGTEITHHWGGVLAAPRDWTPFVRYDRSAALATAGGYVGDGVATTHLAGRTLAALITGSTGNGDDELVRLPWVGHRSRAWEPEPLRWLGVNGTRMAAARSDRAELRTGRPSRLWGGVIDAVLGKH
jgi:glycine/D-amino acid oxidase-like deaminating enzyme